MLYTLQRYLKIVISSRFYGNALLQGPYDFGLSFGAEKLSRVPPSVAVGVVQNAKLILARQKQVL